jgi:kynureninase
MSEILTAVPAEVARWREQFPILASSTYLVSHSMGAAPLGARAALETYWEEWAAEGPEAWERWLPRIAEIADGIGAIVGAPPGSCFLGPNVSVLQAAIATCIDFRGARNEIVYEALQFPSLTYVWREWERYGAVARIVGSDDGRTIPTERLVDAITEHTAIAVLSHAYYVSGAIADVRAIQAHCRKVGALLCVDAYQTTGVYPYDVTSWDLDLVTGGSHKWLCGGSGCGWIYVKPALLERFRPAITGWMAHARPFAFEPAPIVHAPSMYRFGHGTPTIPGYMVAQPGHAMIASIGMARIRERNVRLTEKIAGMALERGLRVNSPREPERRTGWIGIDFDDSENACRRLIDRRVFTDYRPGCGIRVGPHFYTTEEEIDEFFAVLESVTGRSVSRSM